MALFNKGDIVKRMGPTCFGVTQGHKYVVRDSSNSLVQLIGVNGSFDACLFELVATAPRSTAGSKIASQTTASASSYPFVIGDRVELQPSSPLLKNYPFRFTAHAEYVVLGASSTWIRIKGDDGRAEAWNVRNFMLATQAPMTAKQRAYLQAGIGIRPGYKHGYIAPAHKYDSPAIAVMEVGSTVVYIDSTEGEFVARRIIGNNLWVENSSCTHMLSDFKVKGT